MRALPHLQGVSCRIRMCKINPQNQSPKQMLELVSHLRLFFFQKSRVVGRREMMWKAKIEELDCNKAQSIKKNFFENKSQTEERAPQWIAFQS